ncbi:MAG TPA: YqiA/YcfP family alpha/beta fold hydrolase [Bryobacteraceae bacterium]|jgi:pimeloyl-ACP methyl ester carboxylesterase|nr:YqiA/YcfP family alpha/beta fold hydrolase [Bryobacteraceae bacterium]
MRIVYLHGFASSPQSGKARFFAEKFRELGVPFNAPQLDEGNFEGLTITGQLNVIDRAVGGEPAVLMGSSLGGYLAALYAARSVQVDKLVLLAPAFQFPTRWRARYSDHELELWRHRGTIPFFHYGFKEERGLGYQIVEDALKYEDEPAFRQPALVLHGIKDEVVPADLSKAFAEGHPNVTLRLLDSGHELTDVLDELWMETAAFLQFQSL